jgi:transposase
MARPLAPDYNQSFLFPPTLEDLVPPDHPARFVREFVDELDLASLNFALPTGENGRPAYAPSVLLKIWLYGYTHRLFSSRKLEVACREHLSLLWLTGMLQPDHNTLWRFWRDNRKAVKMLFKRSVQVALKADLVGLVLQALDGTKIQAVASGRTGWSKEKMEKVLAALDAQLDQAEAQIEAEAAPSEPGYRLPKTLEQRQALREAIKTGLDQLQATGAEHYHRHEPEAQRMNCDGKNRFGYDAQAMVDEKAGVIVAAEVTDQADDTGKLIPMIEQAAQNVPQTPATPVTVADSGYGSGSDIAAAEDSQLDVLVYPREGTSAKDKPYHAHRFHYDPAQQQVTCPQSKQLDYAGTMNQKGQPVRVYQCKHMDCPVRAQCTREKRGRRKIEIWPHTPAVQAMRQRLKEEGPKAQLRRRGQIVERVFAQIKQQDGFRRWTVRGMENVRAQWSWICCAVNLRAIYKQWRAGRSRSPSSNRCMSRWIERRRLCASLKELWPPQTLNFRGFGFAPSLASVAKYF